MKAYFIFFILFCSFISTYAQTTSISVKINPQGLISHTKQVRITFSDAITAAQNNQNALDPVTSNCFVDGSGYWVDSKTWVYNFSQSPNPDTKCLLNPNPEFIKSSHKKINFKTAWFQTQAIMISQLWPNDGSVIDSEQIFLIKTNVQPSIEWINKNVFFLIKGIGNKIPVSVLSQTETQKIYSQLKKEKALYDEDNGEVSIVGLKAAKPFPRTSQVEMHWLDSYAFNVEPDFTAKLSCERETADSGCLPLSDIYVNFSQPIFGDSVSRIYLQTEDGRKILPFESANLNTKHIYSSIRFLNPFLENKNYVLVLGKIKSIDNEDLLNASSFPLKIRTDALPSLLKVDSKFSVIENDHAFLPITVRHEKNGIKVMNYSKTVQGVGAVLNLTNISSIISLYDKAKSYTYDDSVFKNGKPFEYVLKTNPDKKTEVVGIPLKSNGVHFIEFKSEILGKKLNSDPNNKPYFYVRNLSLVTDLSLILKYTEGQYLVWVSSLKTGLPVKNATVYLYSKKAELISRLTTNSWGLAEFSLSTEQVKKLHSMTDLYTKDNFFVFAQIKDDFSFLDSSQNEGLEKYRYSLNLPYENPKEIFHALLEKNLLKPKDTLKGKIIYRQFTDSGLSLKRSSWPQKLYFKSYVDDKKFSIPLIWDKSSAVATFEWTVSDGSPNGKYIIGLNDKDDVQIGEFSIENFKVPLLDVKFNALRTPWVADQTKTIQVSAQYLNGGAAIGLPIKLRYSFNTAYLDFDDDFSSFTWSEGPVKTGLKNYTTEDETDNQINNRQFKQVDFKISDTGFNDVQLDSKISSKVPQQITVTAEYKDANGEYQSFSRSYDWYLSNYFIGIKNDTWSVQPVNGKLTAQLLTLQKEPVSDKVIEFKLYKIDSFSTRKKLIGGFYTFDSYDDVRFVKNLCQTKTNSLGLAQCQLNDASLVGDYFVEVTATDTAGQQTATHRRLYISKTHALAEESSDRVDLLPNKRIYKPGEVAELKLESSISSGQILLTVESNKILHKEIIKYSNENPIIKLKIKPDWAPNVVVAAHLIRGRLKTADALKVGSIDLAKPTLKVGMTNIIIDKDTYTLNVKVKTDRSVYQPRENVVSTITVTDDKGQPVNGEAAIAVIDEGLLKLKPNLSWNLLDTFHPLKPDLIESAYLMTSVLGRRTFGLKAVPAGGDGRSSFGSRDNFETSLYWNPRLQIKNGQAKVEFKTNDSLSSFRIVAIVQSKADLFGTGHDTIKIAKDIQTFSELPLAVRSSDKVDLNYTVYNSKPTSQQLKAQLIIGTQTLETKTFHIEPKKSEHLSWSYDFTKAKGNKINLQLSISDKNTLVDRLSNNVDILDVNRQRIVFSDFQQAQKIQFDVIPNSLSEKAPDQLNVTADSSLLTDNSLSKKFFDDLCFESLESELAKFIVTGNKNGFEKFNKKLVNYQDSHGYLSRYPINKNYSGLESNAGDIYVTNFVLQIAAFKGWDLPKEVTEKSIKALRYAFDNKIDKYSYYNDNQKLSLRADTLLTLNLYKKATAKDIDLLKIKNLNSDNTTLASIAYLFSTNQDLKNKIYKELENRKTLTSMNLSYKNVNSSAYSEDQKFLFLMLAQSMNNPQLKDAAYLFLKALWPAQIHKLYFNFKDMTWMNLGLDFYKSNYEKVSAKGSATVQVGKQKLSMAINKTAQQSFDILDKSKFEFKFQGQGSPWVTTFLTTKKPPIKDEFHGLTVKKIWIPIETKDKNKFHVGDIWKIKISIKTGSKINWLTVLDPLPAGATLIDDVSATYTERRQLEYRFVIDEQNTEDTSYEYTVRLNQAGLFKLPTSRIEAQYEPALYAEILNKEISIEN